MLNTTAQYPAPGSDAFLAPTGQQVRIQRRNADGTVLVSIPAFAGKACGNTTVPAIRLHPTRMAALNAKGRAPRRTVSR